MILSSNEVNEKFNFNKAIFPGTQGGPLMHVIAAKAVCFKEALEPEFKEYQMQVVKNAKALCEGLKKRGVKIVSGDTDNHLMLVDLTGNDVSGKELEKRLDDAHITCNKNTIPNDPRSPFVTSGVRLGTPAVTTRGMKEDDMDKIAEITLFLNPSEESYRRLGCDKAPRYITWSDENRSQLIRIPAAVGEYRRAELRSADPTANPYLAYALLIYAGMYGIGHDLQLPPASDFNVYTAPAEVLEGLKKLPGSLYEAAALAEASSFVNEHLPKTVVSAYCHR